MTAAGPASKCLAAGGSAPSAPADSELIGIFKAAAAGVGAGDDPRCARCSMAHDNLPIHAQRYSINCGCCSWTGRPSFMVLDRNAKYRCWTLDRRRLRRPERIALEVAVLIVAGNNRRKARSDVAIRRKSLQTVSNGSGGALRAL